MSGIGEHDSGLPAGTMGDTDVPGLDLARFRASFEDARPGGVNGPHRARVIVGGKSNLTYEVTDGQDSWIVRRPPLGHVLATAHDMSREHRVMTALHPTDVPVPATYALREDTDVIGAPFYVMERVDGTPYRLASQLEPLGPERIGVMSARKVDTLATLHRVDPAEVGLSDFGRPAGPGRATATAGAQDRLVDGHRGQPAMSHDDTVRGDLSSRVKKLFAANDGDHGPARLPACPVRRGSRLGALLRRPRRYGLPSAFQSYVDQLLEAGGAPTTTRAATGSAWASRHPR